MPLYIPFVIFAINGVFAHSFTTDDVYVDKVKCEQALEKAVTKFQQEGGAPEGVQVSTACILLPPSIKTSPTAPQEPKPTPSQKRTII